jgi:amino acid transporter
VTTTPTSEPAPAEPTYYTRNATGLVREVSLLDQALFSASSASPLGAALALGLFYAMATFPRSNILLAVAIAIVLSVFVWVTMSLLAAAMPKVGGDYIYNSRIVHPLFGLIGNVSIYIGTLLIIGLWAYWFAALGVVPAFAIIGTVTETDWWLTASTTLSSQGWLFAMAAAAIVALSILAAVGTKLVVRTMTVLYAIGFVGFLISFLILLFNSKEDFIRVLNEFSAPITGSADSYNDTIASATEQGLELPGSGGGYSAESTLGAIYVGFTVVLYTWIGVYMAGELRGGGQRKRQLISVVGSGLGQGLLLLLAAAVFLGTVGYDFFAAANAGAYEVPVPPYYNFFASVLAPGDVLAILLGLAFLCWFFPAMYINLALCHRVPFAWAFDGLIPSVFARVNRRTQTPIISIVFTAVVAIGGAAWASFSDTFLEAFAIVVLLAFVTIVFCGISAMLMPSRAPELYHDSPANWRVAGIPVLPVAGAGCTLVGAFAIFEIIHFHEELGVTHLGWAIAAPFITAAIAVAFYFLARRAQRARGVKLELVYKTIPPD